MRNRIVSIVFLGIIFTMLYSCQSESEIEMTSYMTNGKTLYLTYCANCHGNGGEGFAALYPPLTDTILLKKRKQELACFIKNGLEGPIMVNGKNYDGKMKAFPKLADIDIAQLLVYITNSFGNKQGMYTYQQVNQDLLQCR